MENKNIIIILVVIIAILALAVGIMFTQSIHAKEPTKIQITSNKTLYEGKDLTVKLTDLNKTPLAKEKVNITIKNSKGKVVANKTVKTDEKGNAKMDLNLKKGKYDVTVTYGGNKNYTGNNTTQELTIKEKANTQSGSGSTYNGRDLSGGSGESVEIEKVYEGSGVVEGYKGGRKGVWTPSGNFIEEGGGY